MLTKKIGTGTLQFVMDVGLDAEVTKVIKFNKGLPLRCKDFTLIESAMLRKRILEGGQLVQSGLTRTIDRSGVGADMKIKEYGIEVGEIRTEASGFRGFSECSYNFESISIKRFEKTFYVVNTGKHLELCVKDLIGTELQSLIGDKLSDFDSVNFADTDLSDIIISSIIEKYDKSFIDKFILMSVYDSEDVHGDDGVLAKTWYASKGQYFHTIKYTYADLEEGKDLVAIVGGKKFQESATGDVALVLISYVNWLNSLSSNDAPMFSVGVNRDEKSVTVVSNYACAEIGIRTAILETGTLPNWSGTYTAMQDTVTVEVLQAAMLVNDAPLLFRYQKINENNFVSLFNRYIKEYTRYLHRNGFDDYSINDVKIVIDPELMLEKSTATLGTYLSGGLPINFMEEVGLSDNRFFPVNAMNGTGLFLMTVDSNIVLMGDASGEAGLPGTGQVRIKEGEAGKVQVIFDNAIGTGVDHFGLVASNLCDSPFVLHNKLDEREPYINTRNSIMCYSTECSEGKMDGACTVGNNTSAIAEYDDVNDVTNITVTVTPTSSDSATELAYDLSYSLSDGTSQSNIVDNEFVITLPGDKTNEGYVLMISGTITGSNEGTQPCVSSVAYNTRFGTGEGVSYCSHVGDVATGVDMSISYDTDGTTYDVNFIDETLDLANPNDWNAIINEIEAIFPSSMASIVDTGSAISVSIENTLSNVETINVVVDTAGAATASPLTNSCSNT